MDYVGHRQKAVELSIGEDLGERIFSWMASMEHTLEHRIRQRAYEIWNAEGRADGKADEHWIAAEREVLSVLSAPSPASKASAPRKSRKRLAKPWPVTA